MILDTRLDLHTHTIFSDGKNTPEKMILSAISCGMKKIGISDHSYTAFDQSYCIKKEKLAEYRETLSDLKKKYSDRIEVLVGIEQDYYSEEPTDGYDYVIGSVHYFRLGGEYIAVDESPDVLTAAAKRYFDGDIMGLVEDYYATVSDVVGRTNADIIGHFDLIKKFNRGGVLFDEASPRYRAAVTAALDRLIPRGALFEINTGAIWRGLRDDPYPSPEWIKYIAERGGRFILSSDSHSARTLCCEFEKNKNIP